MKRSLAALCLGAALLLVGCAPAAPPPAFTHADGHAAVDQAFARYGPAIVACAHGVALRESNEWPYSNNGTHFGIMQLHQGFWGSIVAWAAGIGHPASFFDPYDNAGAASIAFGVHHSFRYNWPGTTPAGCP